MTKYSMRQLLCIALFLLYCTCGCFAASVVHQLPQKGKSALQTYAVSTTTGKEGNWQPIRIFVYTKFVENIMNECKEVVENETTTKKGNQFCNGANKMTTEKMNILFRKVLPEAIKLHSDRLMVKPVTGKLKVLTDFFRDDKDSPLKRKCDGIDIPEEHLEKGVDNADFVVYVVPQTWREKTCICSKDDEKRPTSVVIRFVPKEIVATRQYIRSTAREIAIGLGFGSFEMHVTLKTDRTSIFINGENKWPRMLTSNTLMEKVKNHYNCQDIKGMISDHKGNSISDNWERRIAKDELMSPYTGESSGMFYTAITLAAFDALPYYTAIFDMAEPMSWGNQSKCEFIQKSCTELAESNLVHSNIFCKENEKTLQCTSDRFALGVCTKDDRNKRGMSDEYKYFQSGERSDLMKNCPIIKPFQETTCETGNETLMPGSIVSEMSRCLDVKEPEFNEGHNRENVTVKGICAKVKCEDGKVKVQYKGQSDKERWLECTEDGKVIKLEGDVFSTGTIVCPEYKEVCTGLKETQTPTINYTVIEIPEPKPEAVVEERKKEEEDKVSKVEEHSDSSTNSEAISGESAQTVVETTPNKQKEEKNSSPSTPVGISNSQQSNPTTQEHDAGTQGTEEKGKKPASRKRRSTEHADATTSPSTPKPNNTENTIQSQSTVIGTDDLSSQTIFDGSVNGKKLTGGQIKEESKNTNIMVMVAPDSSIVASYMVPLAFLVCAVGFVMVP